MTDADAAIWIKDTSSNGVWVNEKKIPKNETVKIFDKDIISFAAGPVDATCKRFAEK
jgi:predicted component of type VI protein secretion system